MKYVFFIPESTSVSTNRKQWILGNTFPFVVFCSFGAFWLGYAATLQPFYNAYEAYKNPAVETSTGLESVGFNVGIGMSSLSNFIISNLSNARATAYFMICMGMLCLIYLVCSIRTNLVFFLIFFTLVPAFGLLAGTFFQLAKGQTALALKLQEAAGAFAFITSLCGWYIFFAIMLASVDFPLDLPRKSILCAYRWENVTNSVQWWISHR